MHEVRVTSARHMCLRGSSSRGVTCAGPWHMRHATWHMCQTHHYDPASGAARMVHVRGRRRSRRAAFVSMLEASPSPARRTDRGTDRSRAGARGGPREQRAFSQLPCSIARMPSAIAGGTLFGPLPGARQRSVFRCALPPPPPRAGRSRSGAALPTTNAAASRTISRSQWWCPRSCCGCDAFSGAAPGAPSSGVAAGVPAVPAAASAPWCDCEP